MYYWQLFSFFLSVGSVFAYDRDHRVIYEQLEGLLWESDDFFSALAGVCQTRANTTISAQWVRLAYHDMSTHNKDDGTGGLDASIVFELDRAQNIGHGMQDTIDDIGGSLSHPDVSFADLIALGAVVATASCGGPIIPFRGGRIDATSAGPPNVPEPHQDFETHLDMFRKQGFDQSEMIALIACGHTLGGVRTGDFPTIVPGDAQTDSEKVGLFDGTNEFDNAVITGYLDGTTANPLVAGPNSTTNSDLRIFNSDRNSTMKSLASPGEFNKTCGTLFEKMINTVPKEVTLTDIIEPMQYKVLDSRLFPGNASDGTLVFRTNLRVTRTNPKRTVKLLWADRHDNAICPPAGCSSSTPSRKSNLPGSFISIRRGMNGFEDYRFDTPINSTGSISKFWFEIDEGDGSSPSIVPGGSVDQDRVLYDRRRTATFVDESQTVRTNLVVAIKGDPSAISHVSASIWIVDGIPARREEITLVSASQFVPVEGYQFFSAPVPRVTKSFDVRAVIAGDLVMGVKIPVIREKALV